MDDDRRPTPDPVPGDADAAIHAIAAFGAVADDLTHELDDDLTDELDDELRLRWDAPESDDLFWVALEILDPGSSDATGWTARQWWESFGNVLVQGAMGGGARDFDVRFVSWGVVFEAGFRAEDEVVAFRERAAVGAALDQLGELGFAFSFGRRGGGGAGSRHGRPRRPLAGAGSAELPVPEPDRFDDARPAALPAFV